MRMAVCIVVSDILTPVFGLDFQFSVLTNLLTAGVDEDITICRNMKVRGCFFGGPLTSRLAICRYYYPS